MKLGVLTNLLGSVSLEEALKYFSKLGLLWLCSVYSW